MMIYDNMRILLNSPFLYNITHTCFWLYERDNHVILKAHKESLYTHLNDH